MSTKGIICSRAKDILFSLSLLALVATLVSGLAQTNKTPSPPTGARFQISAWGFSGPNATGNGCYILDTWTGELWMAGNGAAKKISEPLR